MAVADTPREQMLVGAIGALRTFTNDGFTLNLPKQAFHLDLVAEIPGRYTAPASSAYPYYDERNRSWVAGEPVQIDP